MNRRTASKAITLAAASAALLAGPATAQAPSVVGTWSGTAKTEADGVRADVPVRIAITQLTVGQESGTIRSGTRGNRCTGRLTLRARERGGYTFRDRRTSGRPTNCTNCLVALEESKCRLKDVEILSDLLISARSVINYD